MTLKDIAVVNMNKIFHEDCLDTLKRMDNESINCVITSPPYYRLRDYGIDGQIGLEPTPEEYVSKLVTIFREIRRVLTKDGTVWLNLGDSYWGSGKGTGQDEFTKKAIGLTYNWMLKGAVLSNREQDIYNYNGKKARYNGKSIDVVRKIVMGSNPEFFVISGVGIVALLANIYCFKLII